VVLYRSHICISFARVRKISMSEFLSIDQRDFIDDTKRFKEIFSTESFRN